MASSARSQTRNGTGPNGHGPASDAPEAGGSAGTEQARKRPAGLGGLLGGVGEVALVPRRLAGSAARVAAKQVAARIPTADLDERDADYIRESLPLTWLLSSIWFRGEVRGLGNIPDEGPVLLVGNHSGGNMTPDTWVFGLAFSTYFGVERPLYQLAHNLILAHPGLRFLRKWGTVAASRENAAAALDAGAALLVYPGGDVEVHRPTWKRHTVDFDGRRGFMRLAIEKGVPICPVVSIGGQETALFLSQGEWLAKLLRLDKLLRLKIMPVSLALPWGLNVGDFAGHIPLPAKIVVEVLPPFDVAGELGDDPDPVELGDRLESLMQDHLDQLAAERRLPIIG